MNINLEELVADFEHLEIVVPTYIGSLESLHGEVDGRLESISATCYFASTIKDGVLQVSITVGHEDLYTKLDTKENRLTTALFVRQYLGFASNKFGAIGTKESDADVVIRKILVSFHLDEPSKQYVNQEILSLITKHSESSR